jgi:exopolysaccharide biosynthesis polyprenyl glycosylphosphotransferase
LSKRKEIFLLVLFDFISIALALILYYVIRIESGLFPVTKEVSFSVPLLLISYLFWGTVFTFAGLYQHWFIRSRFDEFASVFKTVSFGCFFLFLIIFLDDTLKNEEAYSRYLILIYWFFLVFIVGFGRVLLRSFQANLLQKGIGLRPTIIIGNGDRGVELNTLIGKYPQLGYKIEGFVSVNFTDQKKPNDLGNITDLNEIIQNYNITEVLLALEKNDKEKMLEIIGNCPQDKVNMKILPDTYEIISGMVRTNQLYGVPLIEVMPQIMSYGARLTKRIIDLILSFSIFLSLFLILIIISILIKITSAGPVFYIQERVGRNKKLFKMYKFRTMFKDAEEYGPEWSGENDPRITRIGRFLRRLYIDEIPQLYNVIKNEMSIVGPRPERSHFVELLQKEIPYYYKRMSVKPGITGWAQVKHKYDASTDDVKEKLQYDFYYIENMSLKLDFKIMINTILVIVLMKGH